MWRVRCYVLGALLLLEGGHGGETTERMVFMDTLSVLSVEELLARLPLSDFQLLQDMQIFYRKNLLLQERLESVEPLDFYSDIFPAEFLERTGHPEDGMPNPIVTIRRHNEESGKSYFRNVLMFSDYGAVKEAQGADFAICSLCSYSGRKKSAKNAYKLHGFCIDLDGVTVNELEGLFYKVENDIIPCPTYLVNSGHGLHVYYIFFEPIPLYPKVVPILQRLKKGLTFEVWDRHTSTYQPQERQFQGIYQGFRVVGSKTKLGSNLEGNLHIVTAFRYGDRVDLATLSRYVDEPFAIPSGFDAFGSGYWEDEHLTLERAKELFPDWYERRIVQKCPRGHYICKEGLYTHWLRLISPKPPKREGEISQKINYNDVLRLKDGNRYWCVATLFIFAIKCGIGFERAWNDAVGLLGFFDGFTEKSDNHFTMDDIRAASKFFDEESFYITRRFIETKTKAQFPRKTGKRLTKEEQWASMRGIRTERSYENVGRPEGSSKQKDLVQKWRAENPNGTPKQCIEAHKAPGDTHLSKNTVYRWWNA